MDEKKEGVLNGVRPQAGPEKATLIHGRMAVIIASRRGTVPSGSQYTLC